MSFEYTAREMMSVIVDEAGWSDVTPERKDDALRMLNRAYAIFMRGVHPIGRYQHVWSFVKQDYDMVFPIGDYEVAFPADFDGLIEKVYDSEFNIVEEISFEQMRSLDHTDTGTPTMYAMVPDTFTESTVQGYSMMVYPTPEVEETLSTPYHMEASELSDDAIQHMGGSDYSHCILSIALGRLEIARNRANGVYQQEGQQLLAEAIELDSGMFMDQPTVSLLEGYTGLGV